LSTLRLGNNAAGTKALFGEVAAVQLRPFALPDAGLATAPADATVSDIDRVRFS
jgi:hypothetical protein